MSAPVGFMCDLSKSQKAQKSYARYVERNCEMNQGAMPAYPVKVVDAAIAVHRLITEKTLCRLARKAELQRYEDEYGEAYAMHPYGTIKDEACETASKEFDAASKALTAAKRKLRYETGRYLAALSDQPTRQEG